MKIKFTKSPMMKGNALALYNERQERFSEYMSRRNWNYKGLLDTPEWHDFVSKVKSELGGDSCMRCDATSDKARIDVHHKYYLDSTLLWDYPLKAMEVLCDDCHNTAEKIAYDLGQELMKLTSQQWSTLGRVGSALRQTDYPVTRKKKKRKRRNVTPVPVPEKKGLIKRIFNRGGSK